MAAAARSSCCCGAEAVDRAARFALALFVLVALAVAIDNLHRPLANPDEGRYSEISREMAASGDWITPRLNGIKYFEKPPLQYWATAAAFRVFGESALTARLYVAGCGLATLLLIGFALARLHSREAGLLGAIALLATPYFAGLGAAVTLDMGFTLWTTAGLCAFLLAHGTQEPRVRGRWLLLAWAAAALAVLSKGLAGLLFPAATLVLYAAVQRDLRVLRDLEWIRGPALFLAIAAPWFLAVSAANPEFARFFFIHEHFERFFSGAHRRSEPWWYFAPILLVGWLPWTLVLFAALRRGWRAPADSMGVHALRFALLWSAFVLVFASATSSQLQHYLLPAFPARALVLGPSLAVTPARSLARGIGPIALVALGLAIVIALTPGRAQDPWVRQMYVEAQPWGYAAFAALGLGALVGAVFLWRGRRLVGLITVAIGTLLMVGGIQHGFEKFSPRQSGEIVALKMKALLSPATRVYSVQHYEQTIPFYLGRTMTLVDYVDEFALGLASEPERGIARIDDFVADWQRPGDALAIMSAGIHHRLRERGLPMQIVHQDPRRLLVRKP